MEMIEIRNLWKLGSFRIFSGWRLGSFRIFGVWPGGGRVDWVRFAYLGLEKPAGRQRYGDWVPRQVGTDLRPAWWAGDWVEIGFVLRIWAVGRVARR